MKNNFDGLIISRPSMVEQGRWSFQQLLSCEELRGYSLEINGERGHFERLKI